MGPQERLLAEELLKKLSGPVEADVQKTVTDSEEKPSEPDGTIPAKTTVKTNTSAEQPSKATEGNKTDGKVVKKSEKPKAKASKKTTKTETQTKAKADKTKTTTTEKKNSKTANKTKPVKSDEKEKPPGKKTGKATVKNTANDKKTKSKTTETKDSTAEKHNEL